MHEDQKEWFEYLFALVLNAVFLALAALLLWPLGRAAMALQLAKGYWVFWSVLIFASIVLRVAQRLFRVDIDSRFDAYVLSGLAVSAVVQAGWCAYAALTVESFTSGIPGWIVAALHAVGFLSCWVAYIAVSALYMGSLYRLVNAGVALAGFVVFSLWTAGARAIFGWFFELFKF